MCPFVKGGLFPEASAAGHNRQAPVRVRAALEDINTPRSTDATTWRVFEGNLFATLWTQDLPETYPGLAGFSTIPTPLA